MLDAALEGRGIGELSATTHCGGGGGGKGVCDMVMFETVNVMWGEEESDGRVPGSISSAVPTPPSDNSPFSLLLLNFSTSDCSNSLRFAVLLMSSQ
jgi:hypothetical protein